MCRKGKVGRGRPKPVRNSRYFPEEAETHVAFNESCLPEICKPGGMVITLLLVIQCRYCSLVFYLCRSCYRGQCYCSAICRSTAQRYAHREAQQLYRQTEKGRKAHCRAEQRRRLKKNCTSKKNMDDEGSTPDIAHVNLLMKRLKNRICCCCCGVIGLVVDTFPRRGYGKDHFPAMQH